MQELDQQIAAARAVADERRDLVEGLRLDLAAARHIAAAAPSRPRMDAALLRLVGYVRHVTGHSYASRTERRREGRPQNHGRKTIKSYSKRARLPRNTLPNGLGRNQFS